MILSPAFKPLRMIYVDIPQPSGKLQRKLIWYMIYRVKNTGHSLEPRREEDGTYTTIRKPRDITFSPQFVIQSHEYKKEYLDRVIPAALGPIQTREDPNRPLLNSIDMASHPIPLSTERVDKPSTLFKVGDEVEAEVVSIDPAERKIGLSIRALRRTEERQEMENYLKREKEGGRFSFESLLGDDLRLDRDDDSEGGRKGRG